MPIDVDFTRLKTSWTKYDAVLVMEVISSEDKIEKYKNKELKINEPILRSFLGIKSLEDPLPEYWIEIQNFPNEKKLFALFAALFTHGGIVREFADEFSDGNMRGVFKTKEGKQYTNIRSALVEAGASHRDYRRKYEVPFDFSAIYKKGEVGKLFKELLFERITRLTRSKIDDTTFYHICYYNNFHKAISVSQNQFKLWLEGKPINQTLSESISTQINIDKFYNYLTSYVKELIAQKGWDLAYELDKRNTYEYYLNIKDKAKKQLQKNDYIKIPSSSLVLPFFRDLKKLLTNTGLLNIQDEQTNSLTINSEILNVYKQKAYLYFDSIEAFQPELVRVYNIVQRNNIAHIKSVKVANFYSIKDAILNKIEGAKEVYLLGENGDGKSLILMGIYLAFNRYFVTSRTEQNKTGKVFDLINQNPNLTLSAIDDNGEKYGNNKGKYLINLLAYGTHRGRYSTDDAEEYGFMSLFDSNQTLINPVSWLKDQKLLEFEKEKDAIIEERESVVNTFPVMSLKKMFYDILEKNVEVMIEGAEVYFKEKGTVLSFDQLSEGYKSIIIFIADLIYRLQRNQPSVQQLEDLHGVVLIDEINLHLHPKWQRTLINKLRSLFPKIQFICTTHSPTIIQGASEDAVLYRVYRNSDDGLTRVSDPYYRKDLDHMMINTLITSPLFGLDDSRMNSYNDNANTSTDYLQYRINKQIEQELEAQKTRGKKFISDETIDQMIKRILSEELRRNDKSK